MALFNSAKIIMSRRNHEHIQPSSQQELQEINEQLMQANSKVQQQQGEDLLQNPQMDYINIPKLDAYEDEGVDNEIFTINQLQRKAAQKELDKRHKQQVQEDESVSYLNLVEELNRVRQESYLAAEEYNQEEQFRYIDAQESRGSLEGWLDLPLVRRFIRYYLIKFINNFKIQQKPIYMLQLKQMVYENKQSFQIQYDHLKQTKTLLAYWFCKKPNLFIPELNECLYRYIHRIYPSYTKIFNQCYVRINGLPVKDQIRSISCKHLGQIIKIQGVVTTRGQIYNQLNKIYYLCSKCGTEKGPYYVHDRLNIKHGICVHCHSSGPFTISKVKSVYRNHQKIYIQQLPSQVPAGRIPRGKVAILQGDIIDRVKPGQEVQLIGALIPKHQSSMNSRQDFPLFATQIEVNCLNLLQYTVKEQFNEELFKQLPRTLHFQQKFYNSIAPSIYGHYNIKRALTLAIFGGVQKNHQIMHRTRGDINVLLLGDPGIAKSQFLKSIQQIFPKCIYTTGKGASAVGLTACVKMDPQTHQWRLQAGALVLADKGICLIDEFDKMNEMDRTSIHEAMQQQTISISKAGIVTSLKARCSVIAAANPIKGRYIEGNNFRDNTNLSEPILSRFDVLCIMKDKFNVEVDSKLSSFVINQHIKSHPMNDIYEQDIIILNQQQSSQQYFQQSPDFIKQYIRYARENINPHLTQRSANMIRDFYSKIRQFSIDTSGMSITPRHLQSMIRLCQANAKMHLRRQTNQEDAKIAIKVMLDSFVNTQKHSTANKLKDKFKSYC